MGRIHEQILPARASRLNGEVAWSDISVVHAGSDQTAGGRARKFARDIRLLELDLRDRPEHPFVLFNFGMTYSEMRATRAAAVAFLNRCLHVSAPAESHVRKAYAILITNQLHVGNLQHAERTAEQGLALYPEDCELLFLSGIIAHHRGRLESAVGHYQQAMVDRPGRHFSSMDPAIKGFKSRHNLALVYADMGRFDLAELQWRQILVELPDYQPAQASW